MKKSLFAIGIIGLAALIMGAQYGSMDVLGILKVNTIQKLDAGTAVYVEDVFISGGQIGAPTDRPDIYTGNLNVSGTVTGSIALVRTCDGRLTLESGVPVSTSDQAAKTTLYFTPYLGNQIALYNGSAWAVNTFTERSLDISGYTADKNYDIFIYDNSGTLTLEGVEWTNNTTRATALATQNGIYVKTGAATRRYLGTIRITATTGQCEDSFVRRFIWNMYNRETRIGRTYNSNNSWSYTTAAYREYNGGTGQNRAEVVVGLASLYDLKAYVFAGGMTADCQIGVCCDAVNNIDAFVFRQRYSSGGVMWAEGHFGLLPTLAAGYHYFSQMEYGGAGMTNYGTVGVRGLIIINM